MGKFIRKTKKKRTNKMCLNVCIYKSKKKVENNLKKLKNFKGNTN